MSSTVLGVVLPGTCITPLIEKNFGEGSNNKDEDIPTLKLGNGLIFSGQDEIISVKAGVLHYAKPNKFWVEARQRRYVPVTNDLVIGIITAKLGEAYKVDIGGSAMATLPISGFDGTTRKNRPNMSIGDVIFGRVSLANKDLEPEVVCLTADNQPEGFGEVKEGMLFRCACTLSRSLQTSDNLILNILGKHFAFEIIAGANGRFIIIAAKPADVIFIGNCLCQAEGKDSQWIYDLLREVTQSSS